MNTYRVTNTDTGHSQTIEESSMRRALIAYLEVNKMLEVFGAVYSVSFHIERVR